MFETWKEWRDDSAGRLYDYAAHEQYDPEPVYQRTVRVLLGEERRYRNLPPEEMEPQAGQQVDAPWDRQLNDGSRPVLLQKAYDISPGTPVQD